MVAMSGSGMSMTSEINVTPMIDVLLVLLIIFMVIVPALPRGEVALIPKSSAGSAPSAPVVLEVLKESGSTVNFRINQQLVAREELQSRLAAIYVNRAERVLFVKGDDHLRFTQVAEVLDMGHSVGIDHIGLMTPGTMAAL